jgi:pilus assembly protein CpaF
MYYIQILENNESILDIPLENKTYLIGNLPYADIYIDSPDILPEHAKIIKDDRTIQIYSLSSLAKVSVGGHQIKSTLLELEDTVSIGKYTICFSDIQKEVVKKKPLDLSQLRVKIHVELIDKMDLRKLKIDELGDIELWRKCERVLDDIIKNMELPEDIDLANLKKDILNEALGLGPLEDLLKDETVTEIMVNGKDKIYIERAGKLELTDLRFTSDDDIKNIISRIVNPIGRHIDESTPMVDARLKDGSRVHAVIPPVALQGPLLDIRKFSKKKFTDNDLIKFGSVCREIMDFLKICVQIKKSILISGGTGTGKTSFLNVMASYISHEERVLTIEDAAELRLPHENLCSLEARPPNVEGKGEITIRDLVIGALRMRPDRIIVGECRGSEAVDMLQAMNTGHEGSMTTIHANTTSDAILRLETMVMMAKLDLSVTAIRRQIASAIHLIVQQVRLRDGSRRVVAVSEMGEIKGDSISLNDIFVYNQTGIDSKGKIIGTFVATGYVPKFFDSLESFGIKLSKDTFKKDRELK